MHQDSLEPAAIRFTLERLQESARQSGWECQGCRNLPVTTQQQWAIVDSSDEEDDDDSPYSSDDNDDNLETEVVTDEFTFTDSLIT